METRNDAHPLPETTETKSAYFRALAQKYRGGLRLLFRGGHLGGDWRNVVEHSLVQTAAAEEFASLLREALTADEIRGLFGVEPEGLDALARTAIIHDWDKKFERRGGEPNARELRHLEPLDPDPALLEATKIPVLEQLYLGNKTYTPMQDLQFFLDIVTRENDLTTPEERIAEVSSSPRAADVGARANGEFWKKNLEHAQAVEARLFAALHGKVAGLERPSDLAPLLKRRVEARWKKA